MVQEKIKVLVITGPTAVGKSAAGVLAALKLDGEVIGADSMQIYKGMNIGTGKITKEEMMSVPHHMIDIASPNEDYSVGRYVAEAAAKVDDIASRGKLPIIVGGTGLYIIGLLTGHSFAGASKDEQIREKLNRFVADRGAQALHDELKKVDLISANSIAVNDVKRVIRALEIYMITGKPKSELRDETEPIYDYELYVLFSERLKLYERIEKRVDKMFDNGLIDEVKKLYEYRNCNSMQAIGYKEAVSYLDGKCSLDETIESVKRNSRRYAKRQMTFFRGMKLKKTFVDAGNIIG